MLLSRASTSDSVAVFVNVDWVINVLIDGCMPIMEATKLLTTAVRAAMALNKTSAVERGVVEVVGFDISVDGVGI